MFLRSRRPSLIDGRACRFPVAPSTRVPALGAMGRCVISVLSRHAQSELSFRSSNPAHAPAGTGWRTRRTPPNQRVPVNPFAQRHLIVKLDRVMCLLPLGVRLPYGTELLVKRRKTFAVTWHQGIFVTKIPVVAHSFQVLRALWL